MVRSISVATRGQGLVEITGEVSGVVGEAVRDGGMVEGLCTVFIRHTSASLTIQENADPSARRDLARWLSALVPDADDQPVGMTFSHVDEGPDDMPAHIKSVLTATSLGIPIVGGRLGLGTWQGIYVWEHRARGHTREVLVHVGV